jgi:hypothetical protein
MDPGALRGGLRHRAAAGVADHREGSARLVPGEHEDGRGQQPGPPYSSPAVHHQAGAGGELAR